MEWDAAPRTVCVSGIRGLRGMPGVGADGIGEDAIAEFFAFDCGQARPRPIGADPPAAPCSPAPRHAARRATRRLACAQVLSVRIASGIVFVEFADVEGAQRALQKDGVESGGHVLSITSARGMGGAPGAGQGVGGLGSRGEWFGGEKVADGVGAFPGLDGGRGPMVSPGAAPRAGGGATR